MNRAVSDLLSQSAQQNQSQLKRLKCPIIDVLFPSRSFVVLRAGYGRQTVSADSNIDFGTFARPLVGVGNFVWIELNESDGTWHATKYEANATCTPTTLPNAPNVPLTTYKPPQNTSITFEPFRVDTNFFPHVASIGLLAPASKSPAQTVPGAGATAKISFIGSYRIDATYFAADAVAMLNDNLFVHGHAGSEWIFSCGVSDLTHIALEQKYIGAMPPVVSEGGLCAAGTYLYTMYDTVLYVYDVSDPHAITLAGQFDNTPKRFIGKSRAVTWSYQGTVYVTQLSSSGATNYISTFNVTTPGVPALVSNYAISGKNAVQFDLDGIYLYATTNTNHLVILNYTNPAAPTVVSTTALPITISFGLGAVVARQGVVYASDDSTPGMIVAINTSTLAAPVAGTPFRADPTDPHALGGMVALRMITNGVYLICLLFDENLTSTSGLSIFSLDSPLAPKYLDRYDDYFFNNQPNANMYSGIVTKNRMIYCSGTDAATQSNVFVFGY